MKFQINEYVWDRIWDSPAVVVRVDPKAINPYVIAQVTQNSKTLGRTTGRPEDELCRFVNVKLPEDEALLLITTDPTHLAEEVSDQAEYETGRDSLDRAHGRIREQLELRGVPVDP